LVAALPVPVLCLVFGRVDNITERGHLGFKLLNTPTIFLTHLFLLLYESVPLLLQFGPDLVALVRSGLFELVFQGFLVLEELVLGSFSVGQYLFQLIRRIGVGSIRIARGAGFIAVVALIAAAVIAAAVIAIISVAAVVPVIAAIAIIAII